MTFYRMIVSKLKKVSKLAWYSIVLLVISLSALVLAGYSFAREAYLLYHAGHLRYPPLNGTFAHEHGNENKSGAIRPWMTFAFITATYSLPPTYLQEQLSLTGTYEGETVAQVAKMRGIPLSEFITQVQEVVQRASAASSIPR